MAVLHGKLYGVRVVGNSGSSGDFLNCEIESSISIQRNLINKSGSHSGKYTHKRYGLINWSITANAKSIFSLLNGSLNNLIKYQLDGNVELEVYISARTSNTQSFDLGGKVLIPSININFPNTGSSKFDITFEGNGELLVDGIHDINLIINEMPIEADKPLILDGSKW